MGKWEAQKRAGCWVARKDHNELIGWVLLTDCDESQATRYALALNIVDAGVGFSDALRLVHEWDEAKTTEEEMFVAVNMAMYLRSIANAVEGDTTKEDV